MDRHQIEQKVMELLADVSDREDCGFEMDMMDDIGLSSVEVLELICSAEQVFHITISPKELRLITTPGDLCKTVEDKTKQSI